MDSGARCFRRCSVAGDGCAVAGQTLIFPQQASILLKKDGVIVNTQMLGSERDLFFHLSCC